MLLLFGALVVAVIIAFYYKSNKKLREYTKLVNIFEKLANDTAEEWYLWGYNFVACSKNFGKLLGVTEKIPAHKLDIMAHLVDKDMEKLQQSILNLQDGDMELELHLDRNKFNAKTRTNPKLIVRISKLDDNFKVIWAKTSPELVQNVASYFTSETNVMPKIKNIMDSMPWPLWIKNVKGEIYFCNRAYASFMEASPEVVVQKQLNLMKSCTSLKDNLKMITIEKGQEKIFNVLENNLPSGDTLGYAVDVTDRINVSKQVEEFKNAHLAVINCLDQPIAVFDNMARLQYFNKAYTRMYDFNPEWLKNNPSFADILEDQRSRRLIPEYADFPLYKKQQLDLMKNLKVVVEDIHYLSNERTLHLTMVPYPLGGVMCIIEDISEFLALERQCNNMHLVQNEAFNALFEGIMMFCENYKVSFVNEACRALLQYYGINDLDNLHTFLRVFGKNIVNQGVHNFDQELRKSMQVRKGRHFLLEMEKARSQHLEVIYYPLPNGFHLLCFNEKNSLNLLNTNYILNLVQEIKQPISDINNLAKVISAANIKVNVKKNQDFLQNIDFEKVANTERPACWETSINVNNLPNRVNRATDMLKPLQNLVEIYNQRYKHENISFEIFCNDKKFIVYNDRFLVNFRDLLEKSCQYAQKHSILQINLVNKNNIKKINLIIKNSWLPANYVKQIGVVTDKVSEISYNNRLKIIKNLVETKGGDIKIVQGNNEVELEIEIPVSNL